MKASMAHNSVGPAPDPLMSPGQGPPPAYPGSPPGQAPVHMYGPAQPQPPLYSYPAQVSHGH